MVPIAVELGKDGILRHRQHGDAAGVQAVGREDRHAGANDIAWVRITSERTTSDADRAGGRVEDAAEEARQLADARLGKPGYADDLAGSTRNETLRRVTP